MTEDGGGGGGGREQSPMISCCRLMSIPAASVLLGDGASHTSGVLVEAWLGLLLSGGDGEVHGSEVSQLLQLTRLRPAASDM
jgi:hypothetical protein